MELKIEIIDSSGDILAAIEGIERYSAMGFTCRLEEGASKYLIDSRGRYREFSAKISNTNLPTVEPITAHCAPISINRISARVSLVNFRYSQPIRAIDEILTTNNTYNQAGYSRLEKEADLNKQRKFA